MYSYNVVIVDPRRETVIAGFRLEHYDDQPVLQGDVLILPGEVKLKVMRRERLYQRSKVVANCLVVAHTPDSSTSYVELSGCTYVHQFHRP